MEEMKVTIDISLRERSTKRRLRAGMRKLKWKDHPELQRGDLSQKQNNVPERWLSH